MTIFLLIRHGENNYYLEKRLPGRLPGIHLNEKGKEQALALAKFLGQKPIKAIYSSPMERTLETAEPLAQALGLPIQVDEGLNELDCGDWKGKTFEELNRLKAWKIVQKSPSLARFPGGETFLETQQHFCSTLTNIQVAFKEKELVVCFSHCDTIRLGIAFFIGMPLDNFRHLDVGIASINTLYLGKGTPYLVSLNARADQPFPASHPEVKKI